MIAVNIDKAKNIAHAIRRSKRAEEFAPLDLKATIPFEMEEAEKERQVVREKYAAMQTTIDNALTVEELKAALAQE
jgi:hypothetical protein